jgi:hypothetical protein
MKVGDIVRHFSKHNQGVIVNRRPNSRATGHNKIFDVLWFNGSVSVSIWDYDLYKLDKIE